MFNYIMWFRERAIFILLGISLIYILIKPFRNSKSKRFNKNLRAINRNSEKVFKEQHKNRILEYSEEDSVKYGFRRGEDSKGGIKRPIELKRKGRGEIGNFASEKSKINDDKYSDALKRVIPLSFLYKKENLSNKTLRVYVEDINDTVATLRDSSAIYKLDLKTVYGIAGEFVLMNISKKGDDIKINYILSDY